MNSSNTYAKQLLKRLVIIRTRVIAFLNSRQFERYIQQTNPLMSHFGDRSQRPKIDQRPINLTPSQKREQNNIVTDFNLWQEEIVSVLETISGDEEIQLQSLIQELNSSIIYPKISGEPKSYNEAIESISNSCTRIEEIISRIEPIDWHPTIFVLDTSAVLECPDITEISKSLKLCGATLVIPTTTMKELEELKTGKRDESFRRKLAVAIRNLNNIAAQGDPVSGILLKMKTLLKFGALEPNFSKLPEWLDPNINDDRILASTIELQRANPFSIVTLLSNDLTMQIKARRGNIDVSQGPDCPDVSA
ncbi:MAG: PIN domain-containing protein [Bellilinea sp.]